MIERHRIVRPVPAPRLSHVAILSADLDSASNMAGYLVASRGSSMDEYTREAIPLIAAVLVLVAILIYFPSLVLVLPQLIF